MKSVGMRLIYFDWWVLALVPVSIWWDPANLKYAFGYAIGRLLTVDTFHSDCADQPASDGRSL